jgi:hypothetical protein
MKLVIALFLGLVSADDTTAVWGLTSTNSEKENAGTQITFGNYATDNANARPPMRSHVQIKDDTTAVWGLTSTNSEKDNANTQITFGNYATDNANARPPMRSHVQILEDDVPEDHQFFVSGIDPEEFYDEEITIKGEKYRFLQKKSKKHGKKPVGVRFIQEKEDPPAKPAGYESVDDGAEKVHVLQTPISPTRTTFYDKKEKKENINLQLDAELESDPICNSAGCTQYKHKRKERGYKIDYFVPNFGEDRDISDSKKSLKTAEAIVGEKFDFPNAKWKKGKVVTYDYNMAVDHDIIDTINNLQQAEKDLNHKWEFGK